MTLDIVTCELAVQRTQSASPAPRYRLRDPLPRFRILSAQLHGSSGCRRSAMKEFTRINSWLYWSNATGKGYCTR